MVLTDHDSDHPMDSREPALSYIESQDITDLNVILGIEADSDGQHFVTFPITQQMHVNDIHQTIQNYKAQGGYLFYTHPLLTWNTFTEYNLRNYDEIDFAGFEIINSGFFGDQEGGIGELALKSPFIGAADAHSVWTMNRTQNLVFVRNLTTAGLLDGILNRRNIVYNHFQSGAYMRYYTGDTDWLEEYARRNSTLTRGIAELESLLPSLSAQGIGTTQAEGYLTEAKSFQNSRNLRRSREQLTNAFKSLYTINIDLSNTSHMFKGSSIEINFSVQDINRPIVNGAKIEVSLYDDLGDTIGVQEVTLTTEAQKLNFPIPADSKAGEFYLWYNVSIDGAFYESGEIFTVLEDHDSPIIDITSIIANGTSTTSTSVEIDYDITDMEGSGIESFEILLDGVLYANGTALNATGTLILSNLAYEGHIVKFIAIDKSGNSVEKIYIFSVGELDAPVITLSSVVVNGTTTTTTNVDISYIIIDGTGSGIDSFEIFVDGVSYANGTAASTTGTLTLSDLTYTEHNIRFVAIDNVGNSIEKIYTFTVVDEIVPTISLSSATVTNGTTTTSTSFDITYNISDGTGSGLQEFDVYLNGVSYATGSATNATGSISLSNLAVGSYTVKIIATDNVGNIAEVVYTITVETIVSTTTTPETNTTETSSDTSTDESSPGFEYALIIFSLFNVIVLRNLRRKRKGP
jgi:hypothetical protein